MTQSTNDHLVLISGESGTGKSASLINLPNQEKVMYLNCEAGKRLPFRNKFRNFTITEPYQVHEAFDHALNNPDYDVIVVDTITFLMEMFESQYVKPSTNTQAGWGEYAEFIKVLMLEKVACSDKAVIILGHTVTDYDEKTLSQKTRIAVKGSVGKGNGFEAYFSTVVSVKKITLKDLHDGGYQSDLLHISEQDELLGYKHVFQTQLTKATIGERIRSPMGMFTREQTYMDNDAGLLLEHLRAYYA